MFHVCHTVDYQNAADFLGGHDRYLKSVYNRSSVSFFMYFFQILQSLAIFESSYDQLITFLLLPIGDILLPSFSKTKSTRVMFCPFFCKPDLFIDLLSRVTQLSDLRLVCPIQRQTTKLCLLTFDWERLQSEFPALWQVNILIWSNSHTFLCCW